MENKELDENALENVVGGVSYNEGLNKFKSMLETEQQKQKKEKAKKDSDELFEEDLDKMAYDYYHGDEDAYKKK